MPVVSLPTQTLLPGSGDDGTSTGASREFASGGGDGANGGANGTVATVGVNSFSVTDRFGQTITVDEQSSTIYYSGSTSTSAAAVVPGVRVRVAGTLNGNSMIATSVEVRLGGGSGEGSD